MCWLELLCHVVLIREKEHHCDIVDIITFTNICIWISFSTTTSSYFIPLSSCGYETWPKTKPSRPNLSQTGGAGVLRGAQTFAHNTEWSRTLQVPKVSHCYLVFYMNWTWTFSNELSLQFSEIKQIQVNYSIWNSSTYAHFMFLFIYDSTFFC